jgi:hypothetical protein
LVKPSQKLFIIMFAFESISFIQYVKPNTLGIDAMIFEFEGIQKSSKQATRSEQFCLEVLSKIVRYRTPPVAETNTNDKCLKCLK